MPARRSDDRQYVLGAGLSASGNPVSILGGEYMFMVNGTPGGSTISLQVLMPDLTTWVDVQVFTGSVVRFTSLPGSQTGVGLPAGQVRCACSGGTPSGINAWLVGLG